MSVLKCVAGAHLVVCVRAESFYVFCVSDIEGSSCLSCLHFGARLTLDWIDTSVLVKVMFLW